MEKSEIFGIITGDSVYLPLEVYFKNNQAKINREVVVNTLKRYLQELHEDVGMFSAAMNIFDCYESRYPTHGPFTSRSGRILAEINMMKEPMPIVKLVKYLALVIHAEDHIVKSIEGASIAKINEGMHSRVLEVNIEGIGQSASGY
ncbi:hypothetical protein QYF36_001582 [Acer negundo]|nr:hypothetical protein QYF36_001582 [Acer negundo]